MDLERRIEKLERRGRWLGLLLAATVGIAAMGAMQKSAPSDSIDTKMLRLYDGQGKLRAFLATSPRGNAALTLIDQRGKVCGVLGVTGDACPSLELSHSDETLRARLALAPDGRPVMEFYDAQGKVTHQVP